MKYLKTSESLKSEADVAYEKRRELQEFSNDYLAYLIDDEWSVSVWGFTTSFKIVLLSPRSVKRNRVHHDDVQWLSVKNHIIPFVQMLSNRHHLGYEGSSSIIRIEGTYSDDIHIRNIEQLEDLSDDMLFYSFSIVIKKDDMKHLKMFKESLDEVDELRDFCEDHLAYLVDDNYGVSVHDLWQAPSSDNSGVYQVLLNPPRTTKMPVVSRYSGKTELKTRMGTPFSHFKARLIPFVYMLLKEYNLLNYDEIHRFKLGDSGTMGITYVGHRHTEQILEVDSLQDLDNIDDDKMVLSFYIRVKKKDS